MSAGRGWPHLDDSDSLPPSGPDGARKGEEGEEDPQITFGVGSADACQPELVECIITNNVCIYVCMFVCAWVHVCVHAHTYMHVCVKRERERERERDL